MRIKFDNTQSERITQNVVSIFLTLMVPAQNSRSGQDSYFTHTAAIGMDYATAARKLKALKEMVASWGETDTIDYRIDLRKHTTSYDIVRCWYCDNGPRLVEMDCDGPYLTSTCERCEGNQFGHFGCNQRETQKANEALKYHMPAMYWGDQSDYEQYGKAYQA